MWTGIELLHVLQDIRLDYPFLEDFFTVMSSRVLYLALPAILVFLFYWCIDKKQGEILALSFFPAMVFAVVSKFGFDQPRPWDLDPGIIKVEGVNVNGLSLPSGHTASTVSSLLPAATFSKNHVISAVLIAVMILVIIGRLVLCVHTPLDIISGIVIGLIAIAVAWGSLDFAFGDDRRYHLVNIAYTVFFTILFIIGLAYWDVGMDRTAWYAGIIYGMIVGRTLDRIYLRYKVPETGRREHALRFLIGLISSAVVLLVFAILVPVWGAAIGGAAMMIWAFFLYPYIMVRKGLFM